MHFSRRILLALFPVGFALCACGGDNEERPELINKLRTLGVEQTPVNAKPGDTVNLTFHLAGPPNQQITPTVLLDKSAKFGVPVAAVPVDAAVSETPVGTLSLYSYRATVTVPDGDTVNLAIAKQGFARVRYNINFSSGAESENVVGDSIVYSAAAPQLTWSAPEIAITKPGESAATGGIDLDGTITSAGNETNRVSWFISSGKVKSRRARTTKWTDAARGTQTVIMTARGTKSGAFAIKAQAVSLN